MKSPKKFEDDVINLTAAAENAKKVMLAAHRMWVSFNWSNPSNMSDVHRMPDTSELEQSIDWEISKMHSVKHLVDQQVLNLEISNEN